MEEMIQNGEFDSSNGEDFYDDEEESEGDMDMDDMTSEEKSEDEFPEDSFEEKNG